MMKKLPLMNLIDFFSESVIFSFSTVFFFMRQNVGAVRDAAALAAQSAGSEYWPLTMASEGVPLAGIPAAGSLVTANPLYPAGIINPFYNAVPLGSVQTTTQKVESPNATTEQKTVTGPAGSVTTTKSDDKTSKTTSEDTKSSTSPSVVHFLLQNHHICFDYVFFSLARASSRGGSGISSESLHGTIGAAAVIPPS